MTRSNINRKNRDRRGGHQVSPIINREGVVHVAPNMKSFLKKHEMKLVRRERTRFSIEALSEMETDVYDEQELNMFGKDSCDMADERHEFEEFQAGYPEEQDPYGYNDYMDDRFFDPIVRDDDYDNLTDEDHRHISGADCDDYRGDIFAEPEYDRRYPIERMTRQPEQRGTVKTLGQILRKYLGEN